MNLENNSKEMATVVETFVIEETAHLIYDNEKLDEWNSLVAELGLEGQTKIQVVGKSPIPFMHLKKTMVNVFETLCPRRVEVEKYSITPIPVEILSLIALSKNEKYFDTIQIWYDDKSPDPACIGVKDNAYCLDHKYNRIEGMLGMSRADAKKAKENDSNIFIYNTDEEYYLLGKWADVKHSFEELKEMAVKRFIQSHGNDLRKTIKEAQRGLDDLETIAFEKFN